MSRRRRDLPSRVRLTTHGLPEALEMLKVLYGPAMGFTGSSRTRDERYWADRLRRYFDSPNTGSGMLYTELDLWDWCLSDIGSVQYSVAPCTEWSALRDQLPGYNEE